MLSTAGCEQSAAMGVWGFSSPPRPPHAAGPNAAPAPSLAATPRSAVSPLRAERGTTDGSTSLSRRRRSAAARPAAPIRRPVRSSPPASLPQERPPPPAPFCHPTDASARLLCWLFARQLPRRVLSEGCRGGEGSGRLSRSICAFPARRRLRSDGRSRDPRLRQQRQQQIPTSRANEYFKPFFARWQRCSNRRIERLGDGSERGRGRTAAPLRAPRGCAMSGRENSAHKGSATSERCGEARRIPQPQTKPRPHRNCRTARLGTGRARCPAALTEPRSQRSAALLASPRLPSPPAPERGAPPRAPHGRPVPHPARTHRPARLLQPRLGPGSPPRSRRTPRHGPPRRPAPREL